MDVFKLTEQSMAMDDATWKRHANPWSFWTRVPILPLLALAIWSRVWLGWWAFVPVAVLVAWVFVNPRAFPPPRHLDDWTSHGVLGERHFLARKSVPIPRHHEIWAKGLSAVAALGMVPLIYSLWALEVWPTLLGLVLAVGGKLWFVDRMAWLHADMTQADKS